MRNFKHRTHTQIKLYSKTFAVQSNGYQIQKIRGTRHSNRVPDATTHCGFSVKIHLPLKWLMPNWNFRSTKPQLTTTFDVTFLSLWYLRKTLLFLSCIWQEKLVLQKRRIWWWQTCTTSNTVGEPFGFLFQDFEKKFILIESFWGMFYPEIILPANKCENKAQ